MRELAGCEGGGGRGLGARRKIRSNGGAELDCVPVHWKRDREPGRGGGMKGDGARGWKVGLSYS